MRRTLAVSAMLTLVLLLAAPAYAAYNEKSISGTVVSLNMEQKTMVVKDAKGVEHTVLWTDTTELAGGPLEQGATLTLKASTDDGGKLVASSIHVNARASKPGKPAAPGQK
jgi:hypothetical protein